MTQKKLEKAIETLSFTIFEVANQMPFIELKGLCRLYGLNLDDDIGMEILKARLADLGYKPIRIGHGIDNQRIQVRLHKTKETKIFYLYSKHVDCYGWTRQQYKNFKWSSKLLSYLRSYATDIFPYIEKRYNLIRKGQEMLEFNRIKKVFPHDVAIAEGLRIEPTSKQLPRNWDKVENAINKVAFVLNPFGGMNQRRLLLLSSFSEAYKNEYLGGKTELNELTKILKEHCWHLVKFPNRESIIGSNFKKLNIRGIGTKYVYVFREHKQNEVIQNSIDKTDILFLEEYLKMYFKVHDSMHRGCHQI